MKTIIKENINYEPMPPILEKYLDCHNFAVLDIETTGLWPQKHKVMLIGIIVVEPSSKKATSYQFFAEKLSEEKEVLEKAYEVLKNTDFVVTFNGKSFDMNFIEKRCETLGVKPYNLPNLDIYVLIKKHSNLKDILPNLKQKTVEGYYQIGNIRKDQIDGGESVKLYEEYLSSPINKNKLEELILLHNFDDICQLYKLLSRLRDVNYSQGILNQFIIYPLTPFNKCYLIRSRISKDEIVISGFRDEAINYLSFPAPHLPIQLSANAKDSIFNCQINLSRHKDLSIIDVRDFSSYKSYEKAIDFWNSKNLIIEDYIVLYNGNVLEEENTIYFLQGLLIMISDILTKSK